MLVGCRNGSVEATGPQVLIFRPISVCEVDGVLVCTHVCIPNPRYNPMATIGIAVVEWRIRLIKDEKRFVTRPYP